MEKTVVGLVGAVGALMAAVPAQASPVPAVTLAGVMQADSYSDLLTPIPNALALLQAAAAADIGRPHTASTMLHDVQYHDHHHHHHHHRHHHHHHHHHNGDY